MPGEAPLLETPREDPEPESLDEESEADGVMHTSGAEPPDLPPGLPGPDPLEEPAAELEEAPWLLPGPGLELAEELLEELEPGLEELAEELADALGEPLDCPRALSTADWTADPTPSPDGQKLMPTAGP